MRSYWYHKTGVLVRRGKDPKDLSLAFSLHASTQRKGHVKAQQEVVSSYKPGKEASPETNPDNTFLLAFQPPDLWVNKFILWYFVMAAQAPKHTNILFIFILTYCLSSMILQCDFSEISGSLLWSALLGRNVGEDLRHLWARQSS